MASIGPQVRPLPAILLLAACLHAAGIARGRLPAQDGIKFLRMARDFQSRPWTDVIRDNDRHPLYPALVALAEPAVSAWTGRGPHGWRIAGQSVAALGSIGLLIPLHGMTRRLFDRRHADLATLGFVLLPAPMAVGHDTLSDSLALASLLLCLRLGLEGLSTGSIPSSIGCGLVAGAGYLARPEVLIAPAAVVIAGCVRGLRTSCADRRPLVPRLAGVCLAFLVMVGAYALVKGQVSEKLSLRLAAGIGPAARPVVTRDCAHWLPPGLDDPAWDFSPKEEPDVPATRSLPAVAVDLAGRWASGLGWVLAGLAAVGWLADRRRRRDAAGDGRRLVAAFALLFGLVLLRHEWRMGYLSDRHVLILVILTLPWSAAGVLALIRRIESQHAFRRVSRRWAAIGSLTFVLIVAAAVQLREPHPSRWGHFEAGRWLRRNASPGEAVLDTRGWATFLAGSNAYDYWHVRQALTDARLRYVVVGEDEYRARSRRGETLRAILAHAGELAAAFPSREGGRGIGVRIFRFERPESWEGLRP